MRYGKNGEENREEKTVPSAAPFTPNASKLKGAQSFVKKVKSGYFV